MGDSGSQFFLGAIAKRGPGLLGIHGGTLGGSVGLGKTGAQKWERIFFSLSG